MCYDVLKTLSKVQWLADQGSCEYDHCGNRYCPDIFGTYRVGGVTKGFVIDCKLYGPRRTINKDDRDKLDRDKEEVQSFLREERRIRAEDFDVVSMFVVSHDQGNDTAAVNAGYNVIFVGQPGMAYWITKLKRGFKNAMDPE